MMNNMSLQWCREGYGDSHGPAALTIGFKLFLTDPGWAVTVWWRENSKKVPAVDHLCTVYPEYYWQVQIQTYFATSVWSLQKRVETERVHISTYGKSKTYFLQHGQLSVQNLLPNPRRIAEPVSRQHSHPEFPSSISGTVLSRQNIPNGFRTVGRFMQDKEVEQLPQKCQAKAVCVSLQTPDTCHPPCEEKTGPISGLLITALRTDKSAAWCGVISGCLEYQQRGW